MVAEAGNIASSSIENFSEVLARAAATNPFGGAVYFGRSYSFTELIELAEGYAAELQDRGIGHGDRIVLQLQNSLQFVLTAFAAWRVGAIVVPVSPMYGVGELGKITGDSGAKVWVTNSVIWKSIGEEVLAASKFELIITTSVEDFADDVPQPFMSDAAPLYDGAENLVALVEGARGRKADPVEVVSTDVAVLTYTSGTTGMPKGALSTHADLMWVGEAYVSALGAAGTGAVCLALAPFAHITGLAMHFAAWVMSASTIVLGYRFNPDYYLDLIERHRVTWSTGAATAFIALIQAQRANPRDLSSLERFGCGGAPIPPRLIGEIREVLGVPVLPGYGLTESTGAITTTPSGAEARVDEATGVVSVGPAMGDAQVSIRDEDGAELAPGQPGEICIRGGGVTAGYWGNEEATREAIRDGWFHTGDSGFLSEDGWLYIVDRTKNMIIASGYKVWPREVEDVVYKLSAVREAAVIGVPDEYRGENVKVFVSLRAGEAIEAEEIIAHCRANLAAYKVPRMVEVIDEIPKNPNGKILHRALRDMEIAKAENTRSAE